jgi:hypothetical protein
MDPSPTTTTRWFGIRAIYHFGRKKDGTNIFEERIVVFSAANAEEVFTKAEREADEYARVTNMQRHPYLEAYEQDGDDLIDGYEVWSQCFESSEDLESFVKSRYDKYEYHPDD